MNKNTDIDNVLGKHFYGEVKSDTEFTTFCTIKTDSGYRILKYIWNTNQTTSPQTHDCSKQQAQTIFNNAIAKGSKRVFDG